MGVPKAHAPSSPGVAGTFTNAAFGGGSGFPSSAASTSAVMYSTGYLRG